jgi:dipeptidyl aminopeptidase/acylaminoacyl peptidase
LSNDAVVELLGGTISSVPERYAAASPAAMLPLGVAQVLIHGTSDDSVPIEISQAYAKAARSMHDPITYLELEGADHLDVIDPHSQAWAATMDELLKLVN